MGEILIFARFCMVSCNSHVYSSITNSKWRDAWCPRCSSNFRYDVNTKYLLDEETMLSRMNSLMLMWIRLEKAMGYRLKWTWDFQLACLAYSSSTLRPTISSSDRYFITSP